LDARTKKQGKSALAGCVALYMATRQPGAEVVIAAADQDQAKDRVLRAVKYAVTHGPLARHARAFKDAIEIDNGSTIKAIPADWKGASGGNYSAVIFDELHSWTFEGQRRLWDELVIPPTVKGGVRWGASYAGWSGESLLLEELWARALAGERVSDLPIYLNKDAGLLAFIDTGEASWRMPWMTEEYIEQTRESERPNTFRRLWLNEWVSGEGDYLPEGAWAACFDESLRSIRPDEGLRMILGIDAATSNDHAGIVGCVWNDATGTVDVKFVREFVPRKSFLRAGKPTIDLMATVGAEVERMHKAGQIDRLVCDPYQLHVLLVEWQKQGIRVEEFPQGTRRVECDTSLLNAVIARQIRHYGDKDLTQHVNNCATTEGPRGLRIVKRSGAMKIDLAVCLSMSAWGALNLQKAVGGWRSMPNPFYGGPPPSEYIEAGGQFVHAPQHVAGLHPPGVTWRNCRNRNKGCAACVAELEAEGYYAAQDEELRLSLARGAGEALGPNEAWEGLFGPMIERHRLQAQKENQDAKIVQKFWRSVRGQLERRPGDNQGGQ
jgi:hypothetical protein